jgi:DNA-binding GntR family transcriptional regulator
VNVKESGGDDLVTRLVNLLRQKILSWSYPNGARLVEEELCREYGTSRSPVREALRVLEAGGLVEKLPRRRYVVKQMDERMVWELYDMRIALETYVVERIAERGVDEEWARRMRMMWEPDGCSTENDPEALAMCDQEFHEALAAEFGNATLLRYLRELNHRIRVFRTVDFENENTVANARDQHIKIIDAIVAGDTVAARDAMVANIRHAQANIREGIKEALARAFFHDSRAES